MEQIRVTIAKDYYSDTAYEYFRDDIEQIVNKLNVFCEIKNRKFVNIVEECKLYASNKDDYTNVKTVMAKGYTQSEWQEYTLYYNGNIDEVDELIDILKRSFTHNNNYIATKKVSIEQGGLTFTSVDNYDVVHFAITDIEFPTDDDIIKRYNSLYGVDYDMIVLDVK